MRLSRLNMGIDGWPPGAVRALVVLSITMIIAWGTLFYGVTLIGPRIMAETGWSKTLIFGAFSLAMLCSGLIAPRVGAWIDAHGGRGLMALGSLVGGLGYLMLAFAHSPVVLYAAYATIGFGMAGSLYDPAFATLARIAGSKARTDWPSFMAGANKGEDKPSFKAQRTVCSAAGRGTFSSTSLRPMSTKWPYCTPLGQVVSQLRQVRQRSKCSWVSRVGATPSSTCLIR